MFKSANVENIKNWLKTINSYNSTPNFGTTRVLFTNPEIKARNYVKGEMKKIGLKVYEDAIGNIFGVLYGTDKTLAPVWTGSHIDTVLNAGMFDGMVGVVGGMEALRIIKESGKDVKRSIVVIVYTSEEPTRFGLCCLGSRTLAGKLSYQETENIFDESGKSLSSILEELGYKKEEFKDVPKKKGDVFAAVELHIEQSNRLYKSGKSIGIVKTICAPTNFEVEVLGCQSHAGGTSMDERADAYAASAEIALELEKLAKESKSEYTTATIGKVDVTPNASNVIPGSVKFSIDIRDCEFESKNNLINKLKAQILKIENRRGIKVNLVLNNHDVPMKCNDKIIYEIEKSCKNKGIDYDIMISGAYHDSMFIGEFSPVAMIFVPSKDGISHSLDEWTDFEDIVKGTDILIETLYGLANNIGLNLY